MKTGSSWLANNVSQLRIGDTTSLYKENVSGREILLSPNTDQLWFYGAVAGDQWTIESANNKDPKAISISIID